MDGERVEGNRLDWREQCFSRSFFHKALQHDTTHLHYIRRSFLFMGMGRMFLFLLRRGTLEACHIDGQTSEKYYQKH